MFRLALLSSQSDPPRQPLPDSSIQVLAYFEHVLAQKNAQDTTLLDLTALFDDFRVHLHTRCLGLLENCFLYQMQKAKGLEQIFTSVRW